MRDDFGLMTEGIAPAGTRVRELAFLHEIAQLATQARDWDELMRSIVDGTTAAMGVEVCSFYLADHERTRLTLAATNGLDRSQVGTVSLAWGEGITGRVAAPRARSRSRTSRGTRGSRGCADSTSKGSPGCCRCRSCGTTRSSASSTSRRAPSGRSHDEIDLLQTIAALLAGIVEKGRLTAEVEARLAQLTALDAARAELLSVVTHELRTPLSVVRVYVDLLAERAERGPNAGCRRAGARRPMTNCHGWIAWSTRSSRRSAARV